ncbi:hypothetical protein F2P81_003717 [Scophthalmus maximus]|uniref:Uncharacterized protein n=1 Tax=Scophthalmus maximus TaxID=52904 RepID=A0A6A4TI97_SCOMX|nr:hypothetical protein F2P81_003717 [Scophthalmus maximus]
MSADLFDFHRGGDGAERMKDGEKRKLTRLNPMRNVGLAVSISSFSYCVTSIRGVFSTPQRSSVFVDTHNGNIAFPELSWMCGPSIFLSSLLRRFHERRCSD